MKPLFQNERGINMENLCRDYSRQENVFMPDEFKIPVTVVGAGATASWLVVLLSKLGIKNITVWDFDKVEEHNLPNQLFRLRDVGELKAEALKSEIKELTGFDIKTQIKPADKTSRLSGIVFILTDTMESRKEIWDNCLKYKPDVKMVVETRMSLRDGRIYTINPMNPDHIKRYEDTLYSDGESETSACGVSQSIAPTATYIASLAVWELIKFHNKQQDLIYNERIFDIQHGVTMDSKFSEVWS